MIKCKNSCPLEKFEGCCHSCPYIEGCTDACENDPATCGEATFDEESGLVAIEQQQMAVIQKIADICTAKKNLEGRTLKHKKRI